MAYGDGMSVLNPISLAEIAGKLRALEFSDGKLLDVGCGRGTTLEGLASLFPDAELYGIDTQPQIEATEKIRISSGCAEALPFADGSFDVLLMECSFSLVQDPEAAASSLFRVLRPGGTLLLTDLYTGFDRALTLQDCSVVRRLLAPEDLKKIFFSAGFFLKAFTDRSEALTDMAIRLVMEGSSCCMSRETWAKLKHYKPRYGMWLFEKRKENNMERDEKAMEYFSKKFNCAQSVLAGCADLTGLDEETALSVSTGFGGGLSCGEICGALSGAVMALGMCFPHTTADDPDGKARKQRVSKDCCERFREEYGCITCRELVEKAGGRGRCAEYVQFAAQLAGDIFEENK